MRYLKICPILAWGTNFNFSIWHVKLTGMDDAALVQEYMQASAQHREQEAIRICLKFLRQRDMQDVVSVLSKYSRRPIEDGRLTRLFASLVDECDFDACEQIMVAAAEEGLFEEHVLDGEYVPRWQRLDRGDGAALPGKRGGHQMTMDHAARKIYLFGGWDGRRDLDDLWVYDLESGEWTLLAQHTSECGGPSARSCHKVCLDHQRGRLYTLGQYLDPESREDQPLVSDFFYYDIAEDKWVRLDEDTVASGGPALVYDHQLCMDAENQVIYCFGGRSIAPNNSESSFSGLYRYDVAAGTWQILFDDDMRRGSGSVTLKSRIGHSMLFHPRLRKLFVLAGQRGKEYLSDFYAVDVDTLQVTELSRDCSKLGGPGAGFTQRATIDVDQDEIFVFSGLMRERHAALETTKNSFWVYSMRRDRWRRVYHNENLSRSYWQAMELVEPCPRFAHQLVYDRVERRHFLFGGNPGEQTMPRERLGDFWKFDLRRCDAEAVLRHARFLIRKQKFAELCRSAAASACGGGVTAKTALEYLQNDVAAVVDESNEAQCAEFRAMPARIFIRDALLPETDAAHGDAPAGSEAAARRSRMALFDRLSLLFPAAMRQPNASLIDVIGPGAEMAAPQQRSRNELVSRD